MTNLFESLDSTVKRAFVTIGAAGSVALLGACAAYEMPSTDTSTQTQEQCTSSVDGMISVANICEQIISARGDR